MKYHTLFVFFFDKVEKKLKCRMLQIIGGSSRVNNERIGLAGDLMYIIV